MKSPKEVVKVETELECAKCGYKERFQHPELVPVRKECPGCLAEGRHRESGLYRLPHEVEEMAKDEEMEELRRAVLKSRQRIP